MLKRFASTLAQPCKAAIPITPPAKTTKRDALLTIEKQVQSYWETLQPPPHQVNAPSQTATTAKNDLPKFMITFPFPYMNGRLHLGHSFSLSKAEFAAGYQRMKGKQVLFPFAYHGTGMPIKACADKLAREIQEFGNPPVFPVDEPLQKGSSKRQWDIMQAMGIPEKEISQFADPNYWLEYFPQLAKSDLKRFGARVDWRRSFRTTPIHAHFDSFVRWQFRKLKELGKIRFGKRYTIYSPLDRQPCMDHDRQTGEGVAPQEYTLVKMRVLSGQMEVFPEKTYLGAATLRPETMYGQTNCFVNPEMDYGLYRMGEDEFMVCTEQAARNLAHQGLPKVENGESLDRVRTIPGRELLGLKVSAPLSKYEYVHVLPMDTIVPTKGTGIVTSVPSDSPDDYAMLSALKKKPEYYGIQSEWVAPFEPIPVVDTPTYGTQIAARVCQELGVSGPKDRKNLDAAKEKAYREGFYQGKMAVGEYAGMSVQEAKPLVRQRLMDQHHALPYWEPEAPVRSRTGSDCVVALVDQWYLDYGDETWKADARRCLDQMQVYHPEVRHHFEKTLDWLQGWACARSYGLGSRLPWDEEWLIESLSDSTIYTSFYTVAHVLLENKIQPELLTDGVWDHILLDGPAPSVSEISPATLETLRREFQYFYPCDLRVSGKDLIPNHLSFYLLNHVALFPERYWPKSIRANGHLLINNEKMSKSTGNFLTLRDAMDRYSADATRMALAEAGDGVEDANFDMEKVNGLIVRVHAMLEWMEEEKQKGRESDANGAAFTLQDRIFAAEMDDLVLRADSAYERMLYQEAMKYAFHEFINARDRYLYAVKALGQPPRPELLKRYTAQQLLLLSPIAPHIAEYGWRTFVNRSDSILHAQWPQTNAPDASVLAIRDTLETVLRNSRMTLLKGTWKHTRTAKLQLFVATEYPEWQRETIAIMKDMYREDSTVLQGNTLLQRLSKDPRSRVFRKNKAFVPFVMDVCKQVKEKGMEEGFEQRLLFDEVQVLEEARTYMAAVLQVSNVEVYRVDQCPFVDAKDAKMQRLLSTAVPGLPTHRIIASSGE